VRDFTPRLSPDSSLFDFWPIQPPAVIPGTCTSSHRAANYAKARDQIKDLRALLWDGKPAVRYMAALSIIRLSSSKAAVVCVDTGQSSGPQFALYATNFQ
jgi:hypothetical protein